MYYSSSGTLTFLSSNHSMRLKSLIGLITVWAILASIAQHSEHITASGSSAPKGRNSLNRISHLPYGIPSIVLHFSIVCSRTIPVGSGSFCSFHRSLWLKSICFQRAPPSSPEELKQFSPFGPTGFSKSHST